MYWKRHTLRKASITHGKYFHFDFTTNLSYHLSIVCIHYVFFFLCCVQVVYWEDDTKPDTVGKVRISNNSTAVNVSGLQGNTLYYLAVCAFNTAGSGPQSLPDNATTKKPREYPTRVT